MGLPVRDAAMTANIVAHQQPRSDAPRLPGVRVVAQCLAAAGWLGTGQEMTSSSTMPCWRWFCSGL
jgi:hypothetical protein